MQDLEKRVENIEKKLNIENATVLAENEKIVWDFILQNLNYLFEIIEYSEDSYVIATTGYRHCVLRDTHTWGKTPDEQVVGALLEMGVYLLERKENKELKNETHKS